ncbi:MAG: ATP-dependent helicase [Fusobacteriaceae bacterium]|jgi:DNA helicase-2/ATP-dependent DNA helicase PcrA|nr:ATP-dependent helicase [Fusobacteriaceae bacterium]
MKKLLDLLFFFGKKKFGKKEKMSIEQRKEILTCNSQLIDREILKEKANKKNSLYRAIKKLERREIKEYNRDILKNKDIDYKNLLSDEQKRALTAIEGKYLVIAGAGSGKTRTIVYRTALLLELGIKEENILMITFTRKAAAEMKERLIDILKRSVTKLEISTFHSFCGRNIMNYKNYFNIEKLELLDEKIKNDVIDDLSKKFHIKRIKGIPFPSVIRMIELLNDEKIKKIPIENLITDKEKAYFDEIITVKEAFFSYKKENKILEFDDLLEIFINGLERNENFKKLIQNKYKYVIVDEYQDSNMDQRRLLMNLVGDKGNLMVVGDDYQSIYGFRGGNVENILRFSEDFSDGYLIKLETNYRSTDEIVSYCNNIANMFEMSYNKDIKGTGKKLHKPEILSFKSKEKEAEFIIKKINELYLNGIKMNEIAILYRNKFLVSHILKKLKDDNIPYFIKDIKNGLDNSVSEELDDKIAMFSVHSSKGLEWDYVFIPVLLDGVFPSSIGKGQMEEEKRLYYVGCSRAKKGLYLTYPEYFYDKIGFFTEKSRFLLY